MGKKKKKIAVNQNLIQDNSLYLDVDRYRLPQTLGNAPKMARQANDKAFEAIRPQLDTLIEDGSLCHSLKSLGVLAGTDTTFIGYSVLANLSQNGLIRAGVEMRADEMVRKWGELTRKGEDTEDDDKITELTAELEKYKIRDLFRSASCLCGYMGGCLLFINDGSDPKEWVNPLILDPVTFEQDSLKGFKLIEPYLVTPGLYNSVNPMADDYFKPSMWYIQGIPVHASRVIYFAENKLTTLLKPAYNFFGLSLAQKVLDAVAHYTENREAEGRLLQKYALTVLKTNMESVLSGDFDTELNKRIKYFVQNRSNDGCAAIDKEAEDLVVMSTSLAGVTDMVRQSMEYVAAMFNEPVVKMWGLSPNGFSTGDMELQNHYDNIKAMQEKIFAEQLRRVLKVLQINKYGEYDDSIVFNFLPLSENDERAIAETNKIKADTDAVLITAGVISEDEARERLIADANSGYNTLTEREDDFPSLDIPEEKEVVIDGKLVYDFSNNPEDWITMNGAHIELGEGGQVVGGAGGKFNGQTYKGEKKTKHTQSKSGTISSSVGGGMSPQANEIQTAAKRLAQIEKGQREDGTIATTSKELLEMRKQRAGLQEKIDKASESRMRESAPMIQNAMKPGYGKSLNEQQYAKFKQDVSSCKQDFESIKKHASEDSGLREAATQGLTIIGRVETKVDKEYKEK